MTGSPAELRVRIAAAFAIGLLLGLERGWQRVVGRRACRGPSHVRLALGTRRAISRLVSNDERAVVAAALLAVGAIVAVGYLRTSRERSERSATGMVAALLVLAGRRRTSRSRLRPPSSQRCCSREAPPLAAHDRARGAARDHSPAADLRRRSAGAPDRGYGPWGMLNPYRIWWRSCWSRRFLGGFPREAALG